MHGPKFSLLMRREGSSGRQFGLRMDLEGILLEDQFHLGRIGAQDGSDFRNCRNAIGTLEIGEFDQSDRGILRAE